MQYKHTMKTKQILSVLIFMLAIPLVSYGQHLCNESHYWMKHANGEEEFYNINLMRSNEISRY